MRGGFGAAPGFFRWWPARKDTRRANERLRRWRAAESSPEFFGWTRRAVFRSRLGTEPNAAAPSTAPCKNALRSSPMSKTLAYNQDDGRRAQFAARFRWGISRDRRQLGLSEREIGIFVDAVIAMSEPVEIHFLWRPQLRDVNDEMVLETAINGRADAIVTFNARDFGKAPSYFGLNLWLQFVATAVAEKVSALETARFFTTRKARANFKAFDKIMKRRRGRVPPRAGDERTV